VGEKARPLNVPGSSSKFQQGLISWTVDALRGGGFGRPISHSVESVFLFDPPSSPCFNCFAELTFCSCGVRHCHKLFPVSCQSL